MYVHNVFMYATSCTKPKNKTQENSEPKQLLLFSSIFQLDLQLMFSLFFFGLFCMCRGVIKIFKYTTCSLLSFKINLFSLSHSQLLFLSSIYKIGYDEHLNYLIIKYNTYIQSLFTHLFYL